MSKPVSGRVWAFVLFLLAFGALSLSSLATAHENHNELGAGPGPAVATEAAPADLANMHENAAAMHEGAMEHHDEAADRNKSFGQRLMSWLGRLHTVVIHFPIAMFVGALGVELFGLWRRDRRFESAAHVMLIVGALGAVAAAFLGWFAAGFYLTDRNPVLMIHRWLGTAIAIFALVLLYLSATSRRMQDKPRTIYLLLLGLFTMAIAVQGYLGGTFMHGGMRHLAF